MLSYIAMASKRFTTESTLINLTNLDVSSTRTERTPKDDRKIWEEITKEQKEQMEELQKYMPTREPKCIVNPSPEIELLESQVFPILLPILESTLKKAKDEDCLVRKRCRFNGIDYIAECLWNKNPNHPWREKNWTNIFDMDWVKELLKKNPRKLYPKSWLWTEEEAALVIQSFYRAHLVRKRDDVQEMRQFWKAIRQERVENTQMAVDTVNSIIKLIIPSSSRKFPMRKSSEKLSTAQ